MTSRKKAPGPVAHDGVPHRWEPHWVKFTTKKGVSSTVAVSSCEMCHLCFVRRAKNPDFTFTLLLLKQSGREPAFKERDGFFFQPEPNERV